VAIKAYYDSSGKIDNPNERFLVLAGFAAPDSVWPQFESAWGDVLKEYGVCWFHMSELMALQGLFSREKGWDEGRRRAFILGLMNVWGKFVGERLQAYSCCLVLEDYRRISGENPSLEKKKAEEVCLKCCVDCCVGGLQITHEDFDVPRPISLYFDRGEPFLHRIDRVWRSTEGQKAQRNRYGWPYQVASITVADWRDVYPLQAADLLAGIVYRHYSSDNQDTCVEGEEWYEASLMLMNHRTRHFDYERLKEAYEKQRRRG
jgi:hypothetical protein